MYGFESRVSYQLDKPRFLSDGLLELRRAIRLIVG